MYESPITLDIADISSQIKEAQDGHLMYEVQQAIGYEIDKEELIKALRYDRDQYQKGYEDGRKDNKWIPVSERMPEESTAVLVWCPTRKNIYCAYYEEKQWWIFGAYWEKVTEEIVAWRLLPINPYREDNE